ncbi:Hypothetical predicted protein [Mytilus galloprovincialis]|uniref:Uncharacterized protein n=1 Tax=Mytilus galloprovincialis TaxID=29158 RepID=A0A8B6C7P2_MYTGA|nr:Hypothetical predicted protein [Mytilus galloprovincialis]
MSTLWLILVIVCLSGKLFSTRTYSIKDLRKKVHDHNPQDSKIPLISHLKRILLKARLNMLDERNRETDSKLEKEVNNRGSNAYYNCGEDGCKEKHKIRRGPFGCNKRKGCGQ